MIFPAPYHRPNPARANTGPWGWGDAQRQVVAGGGGGGEIHKGVEVE